MKFKDAWAVQTVVQQMLLANQPVQQNRTRINVLFNGNPPWTEEERLENKIYTNVNFLEGTRIAHNARQQLDNAFRKPGAFFSVRLNQGPVWMRPQWSSAISNAINRQLRRSRRFRQTLESSFAQIVLHGIGPSLWEDLNDPMPKAIGVDDILVPATTLADMSNMEFLGIYREWTYPQLYDMTHGTQVDKGWNMPMAKRILENLANQSLQTPFMGTRWLHPEKLEEDLKENSGIFMASAAPKVLAWDFLFRKHDSDKEKWERRIILDWGSGYLGGVQSEPVKKMLSDSGGQPKNGEFLYESKSEALMPDSYEQFVHFFFGNCSNVAPFRYYSIRSVGYLLYAVCQAQNRMRCRFQDAILESMLWYFRNVSEDDREKVEKIDLHHMGIIPDGLSFVLPQERMTINENLVLAGLNQNRQLMAESASSYLPDSVNQPEGSPAMTATEAVIRSQAASTLTSAVINRAYDESEFLYREICRRFCIKGNRHSEAVAFREEIARNGVPMELALDFDAWDIIPERVLGGGNKAVEMTVAKALFDIGPTLDPNSQREATRRYVLSLTDDPGLTELLVPHVQSPVDDASVLANLAVGTLMGAFPVQQKQGINEDAYVQTMIQLLGQAIQQLGVLAQQPNTLPEQAQQLAGCLNVLNHTEQHLALLARDPRMEPKVKQYQQAIMNGASMLKGIAQRVQQAEQAQQQQAGPTPEAQAKIIDAQIKGQTQAQIQTSLAALKEHHKDAAFFAEQQRKDAETQAEIHRKGALARADVATKGVKVAADIAAQAQTQPTTQQ